MMNGYFGPLCVPWWQWGLMAFLAVLVIYRLLKMLGYPRERAALALHDEPAVIPAHHQAPAATPLVRADYGYQPAPVAAQPAVEVVEEEITVRRRITRPTTPLRSGNDLVRW